MKVREMIHRGVQRRENDVRGRRTCFYNCMGIEIQLRSAYWWAYHGVEIRIRTSIAENPVTDADGVEHNGTLWYEISVVHNLH